MEIPNLKNINFDLNFIDSWFGTQCDKQFTDYRLMKLTNKGQFKYNITERDVNILGVFSSENNRNFFYESMNDLFGDEWSIEPVDGNELVCLFTVKQH